MLALDILLNFTKLSRNASIKQPTKEVKYHKVNQKINPMFQRYTKKNVFFFKFYLVTLIYQWDIGCLDTFFN